MIVAIGEVHIEKTKKNFVGKAFDYCLKKAEEGNLVLFCGAISKDDNGKKILEFLINHHILFDPVFCNREERTFIEGENPEYSCIFKMTEKDFDSVFSLNTDISSVYIDDFILKNTEVKNSIIKTLSKYRLKGYSFQVETAYV